MEWFEDITTWFIAGAAAVVPIGIKYGKPLFKSIFKKWMNGIKKNVKSSVISSIKSDVDSIKDEIEKLKLFVDSKFDLQKEQVGIIKQSADSLKDSLEFLKEMSKDNNKELRSLMSRMSKQEEELLDIKRKNP